MPEFKLGSYLQWKPLINIGNNETIHPYDLIAIPTHSNLSIKIIGKLKDCVVAGLLVYAKEPWFFGLNEGNTPKYFGDIDSN